MTANLTNCTMSNAATTVVEGSSYYAKVLPDASCALVSVVCSMGGEAVAVSGGVISISSVTGDIVVTATAEETASYQINNHLTGCYSVNEASTVPAGDGWSTHVVLSDGYVFQGMSCEMGGEVVDTSAGHTAGVSAVTADIDLFALATPGDVTTVVNDFQGTGVSINAAVSADLLAGDYAQFKMCLSSCESEAENIMGFGKGIDQWTDGGAKYLLYYTPATSALEIDVISPSNTWFRAVTALSSDELDVKICKDGLYVNDMYLAVGSDTYVTSMTADAYDECVLYLNNSCSGTYEIGAAQGDTLSKAYYRSVRVVKNTEPVLKHSVTADLTGCSLDNVAIEVVDGAQYQCRVKYRLTYALKSLVVTMGGVEQAVSGDVIDIPSVTGDLRITAVAEQMQYQEVSADFELDGQVSSIIPLSVDFSAGDAVEAVVDVSTSLSIASDSNYQLVFAFGGDLSGWAVDGTTNFYSYIGWSSTSGDKIKDMNMINWVVAAATGTTQSDMKTWFRNESLSPTFTYVVRRDGLWLNGKSVADEISQTNDSTTTAWQLGC